MYDSMMSMYQVNTKPDFAVVFPLTSPDFGFYCEVRMNRIDRNTEETIRRFLALIASRYDVATAIVYGSRARGTHHSDSDVDVAVLLRGEHQNFLSAKLDMADVAFDVLLETGILISPLPVWLDEWEHPESYSNPALLRNIDREGIQLWPTDN